MKLFEHPDFEQAILQPTEHFQNRRLRAAIIEKDYYVTCRIERSEQQSSSFGAANAGSVSLMLP